MNLKGKANYDLKLFYRWLISVLRGKLCRHSNLRFLVFKLTLLTGCVVLLWVIVTALMSKEFYFVYRLPYPWMWECKSILSFPTCSRTEWSIERPRQSLSSCRMNCGPTPLWPYPTGEITITKNYASFSSDKIQFKFLGQERVRFSLSLASEVFMKNIKKLIPPHSSEWWNLKNDPTWVKSFDIHLMVDINSAEEFVSSTSDESYELQVFVENSGLIATVKSASYFGVRHGLETLSQLIFWNEDLHSPALVVPDHVLITDTPMFAYRSVMVDTSRNFIPMEDLLRTLDAMAMCKLNTFHWHMSDSQSFPFSSRRVPQMAFYGAYASQSIYTTSDVSFLTEYARIRGIRVIIEIDAPAHSGQGWNWGRNDGLGEMAVCINKKPWKKYCGQPPCGQLNPDNNHTYDILNKIYLDVVQSTYPTDVFHVGGDEVNLKCWSEAVDTLRNVSDKKLFDKWGAFLKITTSKLIESGSDYLPNGRPWDFIIWTSKMTNGNNLEAYLNKDHFIIQDWHPSNYHNTIRFLRKGYRVIISHVDYLYLDCGFGSWRDKGNGACNPMITWQEIYMYRPWNLVQSSMVNLILGGETCLWGEQVDRNNLDNKLWPRAAALAERLWTDPVVLEKRRKKKGQKEYMPKIGERTRKFIDARKMRVKSAKASRIQNAGILTVDHATIRLDALRERMIQRGIAAEPLWPKWCSQNPGECLFQESE